MRSHEDDLTALLSLPPDRRSLFLRNSRQAYPVVAALVGRCFALRFSDLPAMLAAGQLAAEAADVLTSGQTGRPERELRDLRAHAWGVRGNALRIAGDFCAADETLTAAERHLAAGTGRRRELAALLLELSASLREGQHEFAEAQRLLGQALAIRCELGDRSGVGKVFIKQGIVHGRAGDPERAVRALVAATELIESRQDDLARSALQSLVWHLAEACRIERARAVLADARGLFAGGGTLFQLKVQWLEAKLDAARDGRDFYLASRRYETTRRAYADRGLAREATLVALDLKLLHAGATR